MAESGKAKTITVKTWLCDVCQIASFLDFDEACRHEQRCKGKPVSQDEQASTETSDSEREKVPITPDINKQINGETAENTATIDESTTQKSQLSSSRQVSGQTKTEKTSASKASQCSQVSDTEEVVCVKSVTAPSGASLPTPFTMSARKATVAKKRATQTTLAVESKSKKPTKRAQDRKEIPAVNKPKQKPITKMFATTALQQDPKPLELVVRKGTSAPEQETKWDKEVLAENAAAAFQIKRRLCREQEQERIRKRQKQLLKNQDSSDVESITADQATTIDLSRETSLSMEEDVKNSIALEKFYLRRQQQRQNELERQRKKQDSKPQVSYAVESEKASNERGSVQLLHARKPIIPAPRFPDPSHVGFCNVTPLHIGRSESSWMDVSEIKKSCGQLRATAKYPWECQYSETQSYCYIPESQHYFTAQLDSSHSLFNEIFIANKSIDPTSATLWVNKHGVKNIPVDVCGRRNRVAAEKLLNFVKDWKLERQKSHERRKKRHHALAKCRRIKRKRKPTEDDDLWGDDDIQSDELCSVCLITGPDGSGKSNLVHAVARQSGCKLLEINTTEKRGGQHLRKAIEEATRSHSSMDMLQQRETNLCEMKEVVDSDSEDDGEKEGSSLVVVLIDEVENLFEEEGDGGFWSALMKVTSKSKSPIFLTASSIPKGLLNANMRFTHITTFHPEPVECASKMLDICEHEKLWFREDMTCANKATTLVKLAELAEIYGCDMRRIISQLELFKFSASVEAASKSHPPFEQTEYKPLWSSFYATSIKPQWVPHDRFSLITITGQNFKSLITMYREKSESNASTLDISEICLNVTVAGRLCPKAKIVNNSTILAICPPCRLGSQRMSEMGSSIRYANVSVESATKLGTVSCSSCLHSGSSNTVSGCSYVNLEYHFPQSSRAYPDLHADSDDEKEWSDEGASKGNAESNRSLADNVCEVVPDHTVLSEMMCSGIKALKDENANVDESLAMSCNVLNFNDGCHASLINRLAEVTELNSDAMFLEDLESCCLPLLSGPVRGFGATLTDCHANAFSTTKNLPKATAKPPSEERLYTTGWKDNAYFYGNSNAYCSTPISARERRLMNQSEQRRENLWVPDTSFEIVPDPSHEVELVPLTKSSDSAEATAMSEPFSECAFLPAPFHPAMSILPSLLRTHAGPPLRHVTDSRVLDTRKLRSVQAAKRCLDCLFDDDVQARMFGSSQSRSGLALDGSIYEPLVLDVLPLLRIMGGLEKAADDAFAQALQNPDLALSLLPARRRQTRSSRIQRSRMHYFESFSPMLRRGDADLTVKELGSDMAARLLLIN